MDAIPLCSPNVGDPDGPEARNLLSCIASGYVSYAGTFVSEFEALIAAYTGARSAAATSAGTTALHLGLHVLGVRPGDLVIVPTLTFIASVNAISHCAATPWLLDVSRSDWNLDPELLAEALKTECRRERDGTTRHIVTGKRVAAIVPVYVLGLPADMDTICDIAETWGLPVLADAAAALGATYKGAGIGHTRANLSAISFNANKIITTGGGGILIGNDAALIARANHIATTARRAPAYDHDEIGFNYRMTNLEAAVGVGQMSRIDEFVSRKRAIAAVYAKAFAGIAGVERFPEGVWAQGNDWLSGVFLAHFAPECVAGLRATLAASSIQAPPFWKPAHLQTPYKDAPSTLTGVADDVWERILPLPCSTHLRTDQQARVVGCVGEFLKVSTDSPAKVR